MALSVINKITTVNPPTDLDADASYIYVMVSASTGGRAYSFNGSAFTLETTFFLGTGSGRGIHLVGSFFHTSWAAGGIQAMHWDGGTIKKITGSGGPFSSGERVWGNETEGHIAGNVAGLRKYNWSNPNYSFAYDYNPTEKGSHIDVLGSTVALGTFDTARVYLLLDTGSAYSYLDVSSNFVTNDPVHVFLQDANTLWAGNSDELRLYDISLGNLNLLDTFTGVGRSPILAPDGFRVIACGDDEIALYRNNNGAIVRDYLYTNAVDFTELGALKLQSSVLYATDVSSDELFAIDPAFPALLSLTSIPSSEAWGSPTITAPEPAARSVKRILSRILMAFAHEMNYFGTRVNDLRRNAIPGLATELLPEWETDLGLPDTCSRLAPSIAERQAIAHAKYTAKYDGQSKQFYIDYALRLGITISITEYSFGSVFRVDKSRVDRTEPYGVDGSRLRSAQAPAKWVVTVVSTDTVSEQYLRCRFEQMKPAHTELIWA